MGEGEDDLVRRIDDFCYRLASVRCHFVGFLCFWSMWMLSVSFWKAVLVGFFTTGFMVLRIENRLVTLAVLGLAIAGAAAFAGVSVYDVKQLAVDLHITSG
jgi:hypothetical protein